MINESRRKRMQMAIAFLQKEQLMGYGDVVAEIHKKTKRDVSNIRSALRGDEKYLNPRFVKLFCSAFGGRIPPEWILDGVEPKLEDTPEFMKAQEVRFAPVDDPLMEMPKEKLAEVVRRLITIPAGQDPATQHILLKNAVENILKTEPNAAREKTEIKKL